MRCVTGLVSNYSIRSAWLGVTLAGLIGCGGSAPLQNPVDLPDAEWARSMQLGRIAFDRGRFELAQQMYQHALARARIMDDPQTISDAAYNLAASQIQLGDYLQAQILLEEAKSEATGYPGRQDDLLLLQAKVARLQGNSADALTALSPLLKPPPTTTTTTIRKRAWLLKGLIACDLGQIVEADHALGQAHALPGPPASAALTASFHQLQGCLLLHQGSYLQAANAFEQEAAYLRASGQYRKMAAALVRCGKAYEGAAVADRAADCWFRAARVSYSLGDHSLAHDIAQKGRAIADHMPAAESTVRFDALIQEMKKGGRVPVK